MTQQLDKLKDHVGKTFEVVGTAQKAYFPNQGQLMTDITATRAYLKDTPTGVDLEMEAMGLDTRWLPTIEQVHPGCEYCAYLRVRSYTKGDGTVSYGFFIDDSPEGKYQVEKAVFLSTIHMARGATRMAALLGEDTDYLSTMFGLQDTQPIEEAIEQSPLFTGVEYETEESRDLLIRFLESLQVSSLSCADEDLQAELPEEDKARPRAKKSKSKKKSKGKKSKGKGFAHAYN